MIIEKQIVEAAKAKFVRFGSKHITMDELAAMLGMSKKTIYKYFDSKEDLVVASINLLINEFKKDVQPIINSGRTPLQKIVIIYDVVFDYLLEFKSSFVLGLQKYYPKAYRTYKDFSRSFVSNTIVRLLKQAQQNLEIRSDANVELFAQLYLLDLEMRLYGTGILLESYSKEILLEYMITNNLKGIKI